MTLFHRHSWKVVGIGYGTHTIHGGDVTQIKYRCSCGRVRQEIINGYWTAKELGIDEPS